MKSVLGSAKTGCVRMGQVYAHVGTWATTRRRLQVPSRPLARCTSGQGHGRERVGRHGREGGDVDVEGAVGAHLHPARAGSDIGSGLVVTFLETELAKEAYFLLRDREAGADRAPAVHRPSTTLERALTWIEAHLFEPVP
jgi:hypothetical protein